MKTTITETKAEKMLKDIKGNNDSLMIIDHNIIEQAVSNGLLHKIAERSNRRGNKNIYYTINDGSERDDVLMHVQNNMYVLISRYVYCFLSRELIDVIPYLLQFSFYVGRTSSNRCHVMASCPQGIQRAGGFSKTMYITRILVSLELCGEVINLKTDNDVHHKGDCFDNRQYMLMYIPSCEHNHRDSHMTGTKIKSYLGLLSFFKDMENTYNRLSTVTTVQ